MAATERLLRCSTALTASVLKYAAQAAQLVRFFGRLDGFNVVEVGVGYGGLAHTLMGLASLQSYTFVDLADVERLVQLYLRVVDEGHEHGPGRRAVTQLNFPDLSVPSPLPSIYLFISNNALSEVPALLQQFYLRLYVRCAKRGYVVYNSLRGVPALEMAAMLRAEPYGKAVRVYACRRNNLADDTELPPGQSETKVVIAWG